MFGKTRYLVAAAAWLSLLGAASAQEIRTAQRPIPGRYIVVLNDAQRGTEAVETAVDDLARQYGGHVRHLYRNTIRGFAASMPAAAAAALARNPRVRFVEQDSEMFIVATQSPATWGLDRIDQRDRPLNNSYTYNFSGAGVHAYIIDTGILASHSQFGGRVANGYTAINDGRGTTDCNGHGTHVAGTVGSTTYGVAKDVTLHPVRVLGCNGSGTTSGVIAGVDWVTANHIKPAVANMSLGGGVSAALDNAVQNSISRGVTYAIAAGNSNANACNGSPARVAPAITVGSSTSADARSSFSNFGTCVDIFAPGSSITSAWHTSNTATNTISGTSMASPHVAGVAALYLQSNPGATPSQVTQAIVNSASVSKLTGIGTGSPNRLLYSLIGAGSPSDPPPTAAFTFSCSALTCSFNGASSSDPGGGITTYAWNFGDGTANGAGPTVNHGFPSSGTYNVTLTVTDTSGKTDSETKAVTVSSSGGGAPCSNCTAYTGSLSGTGDSDYHPNGTYYFSAAAGTHRGWLRGPAGTDFDLYLYRWNGFSWAIVARSQGFTSDEQITYNGTSGYYRWRVYSYAGSGSYGFWLQRP